jgi:chemotaxis family two-component system sensor kinase Cph1
MPDFQVDLTNCDREPIHIPGQVQSHGFLIVVDQECTIRYFSDNISGFISGIPANLLGQPLANVELLFGITHQPDFITQLIKFGRASRSFEQINPFQIEIGGLNFNLVISIADECYLLEFEPALSDFDLDVQKMIGRSISEMLADKNLQNLLDNTAAQVKKIINYDRVMLYRFAEDGHGEVVAEAKNEDLDSWLNLHYPASDIPKQARELYKLNLTRLIANVHTIPSKISTAADNLQALDLTHSQLRAVSPIHIQYLKNMGVASSFSISLIYKKELWGLIACHNYTPRFIDYKSRESSKLIGQILSSALEFRQDEENQQIHESFKTNLDLLAKNLQKNESIENALTQGPVNLLNVVSAVGAVMIYEKNTIKLGTTPGDGQLADLIGWINENITENIFYTYRLSSIYQEAAAYRHISGMLVSVLSKELKEYIIWFKPEQLQTIKWAGNPEKPVEINANGLMQISPRNSFEVWSQTVSGISNSWNTEEIKSAIRLKEEVLYAINLKAGAIRLLNDKLRYAYEELDTFSYTISHDLKNPIASIKGYAQLLMRDATIGERGHQLINKIADGTNKMNTMINEILDYSRIGRSELQYRKINAGTLILDIVKDLEMIYDTSNLQITIGDTPELRGDPLMMMQIFSNLISNAVKYSRHANPAIIHIEGAVNETGISYSIKDNGMGIAIKDLPRIFDLFSRMDNVKDIEGSGVGLAIVKRIVEKHKGKIWAESEPGQGSAFYVTFNK